MELKDAVKKIKEFSETNFVMSKYNERELREATLTLLSFCESALKKERLKWHYQGDGVWLCEMEGTPPKFNSKGEPIIRVNKGKINIGE